MFRVMNKHSILALVFKTQTRIKREVRNCCYIYILFYIYFLRENKYLTGKTERSNKFILSQHSQMQQHPPQRPFAFMFE